GAFLLQLTPGGKADVFFIYGKAVTVTGTNGVSQTVSRPGFAITVAGPGASPSPPAPAPPGAIDAVLVQIDGRSGGSGGAAHVPTEVTITNSGISNTISGDISASVQSAVQNQLTNSTITVLNAGQGNTLPTLSQNSVTPPIVPVSCAVSNSCGGSSSAQT